MLALQYAVDEAREAIAGRRDAAARTAVHEPHDLAGHVDERRARVARLAVDAGVQSPRQRRQVRTGRDAIESRRLPDGPLRIAVEVQDRTDDRQAPYDAEGRHFRLGRERQHDLVGDRILVDELRILLEVAD